MSYMGYKGDKSTARPPEGSLVETRYLKAASVPLFLLQSHAPDRSPELAPGCSLGRTRQRALKKGLLILRRCYDTQPQPRE